MAALAPAFADPVTTSQAVFRAVMDAMARPGTLQPLPAELAPPAPLSPTAAAAALALLDYETPFWLDAAGADVAHWLRFHTGAPIASAPQEAAFAFLADPVRAELARFAAGTPEYPDRSTTLVLQVARFTDGTPLHLTGPGIQGERVLAAAPLPADIVAQLAANRALFPRGVDLVLVSPTHVAALPRAIRVGG
jgi:alpha-D-ribose 1-methylphosphonate 5-triphosphate synthase subunit PhnH